MATITKTLTFSRTINAPVAQVYRAFTNATALRQWLCDAAYVDARKDGPALFSWRPSYYANAAYVELDENKRVVLRWQGKGEPAPTEVEVLLEQRGKGTLVTLKHSGIGEDQAWGAAIKQVSKGWETGLDNLQSVLETGIDRRQALRPILGMTGASQLDERRAANLGVPVKEGIVVGGTLEGVGIAAAGLLNDDVVVSIGGKPVPNFAAFGTAMSTYKAGDGVKVEYYRRSSLQTAQVTLASPPLIDVPATLEELLTKLTAEHVQLASELDTLFNGVPEAEASHQPAPGEWSAKETLAHLIWAERYTHFWMWGLAGGDASIPWPDNNRNHINGLIAACPTAVELMAEMRRALAATRGIVAGLGPEFVVNRADYHHLGTNVLGQPDHCRSHFAQIREAVASARKK